MNPKCRDDGAMNPINDDHLLDDEHGELYPDDGIEYDDANTKNHGGDINYQSDLYDAGQEHDVVRNHCNDSLQYRQDSWN